MPLPQGFVLDKPKPPPGFVLEPPEATQTPPGEIPGTLYRGDQPQPEVSRTFMQRALGAAVAPLDVGLTLASGMGRAIAAPIYGLVSGRGEAGVNEVMRGTRQPQTPEAQAALEAIAPALSALPPIIGTGGMPAGAVRAATQPVADIARVAGAEASQAAALRAARAIAPKVAQSQELGPKIDAAAGGRTLGLVVPPMDVAPSTGRRVLQAVAGSQNIIEEANRVNAPKWKAAAREDLGLPAGQKLDRAAYDKALNKPELTKPYEEVARLGTLQDPNLNVGVKLENLKPTALAGDTGEAAAAAAWLSKLQDDVANGLDASVVTKSIRQFRDEADAAFKGQRMGQPVTPEAMAVARAKQGAADALEQLIEQNIQDKTVLYEFQRARTANARIYDYMRATDFATGEIDPKVLADLARQGKPLSGNLAKVADFAANFPEVSDPLRQPLTPSVLNTVRRGGYGGAIGGVTGFAAGGPAGALFGSLAGSQAANMLRDLAARRAVGPRAQAGVAGAMDYRLQTPALTPAEISTNRLLPEVYDWSRATAPNWTPGGGQAWGGTAPMSARAEWDPVSKTFRTVASPDLGGAGVTFGTEPPPTVPLLGVSSAEDVMRGVQQQRAGQYQSDMLRAQAAERRAQEAAQSPYGQMVNQLAVGQVPLTPRGAPATQFQRVQVGVDAQGAPVFEVRPVTPEITRFEPGVPRFGRGAAEAQPMQFNEATGRFYPAAKAGAPAGPIVGAPSTLSRAVEKIAGEMSFPTKTQYQRVQVGVDAQGAPVFEVRQVPLELSPAEAKKYALPTRESQAFNLTAEERIAFNKAKADIAVVEPGFNKLTDAQVAAKMADRAWVADTVQAARDKLAALGRQEAATAEALANRNNLRQMGQEITARKAELEKIRADKQSLMDSLEALEERLRAPRPIELGGQGPKTRAAQQQSRTNMLAPDQPVVNSLVLPENVGGGPRPQPGPVNVSVGPSLESRRPPPAPPTMSPVAQELADAMQAAFGYAPDLAAKYGKDVGWLTDKVAELEKMIAFERMMAQAGQKPSPYADKLPRLLEATKARLKELK